MNLFFSTPVRTYSLLLRHYQAPTIVDQLISTGFVEFQKNPYDDSNDPFYVIYSRIRQLIFKIQALISNIEVKYGRSVGKLTATERQVGNKAIRQLINQKSIDYLSYLDMEESSINDKIDAFTALANNYDTLVATLSHIDEELDLINVKLQMVSNKSIQNEFIILTGICPRKNRHIIQRLIFRKTEGQAYMVFRDRSEITKRDMFICFVNRGVFKAKKSKIVNIFTINQGIMYQLPNMSEHLINYKESLTAQRKEYERLFEISSEQFLKALGDCIEAPQCSLQYHLLQINFLEKIISIICHSKPIGSPANYHLFTIHVPENEPMINLPVPLILIEGKCKQRTLLPRIPSLYQVNCLIELYSSPKYNEIIPSVFMFSTVPILFGMMFSDIGHGLMLLAVASFLRLGSIFYYMAFMSIYCGVIYNEFFGMKIIVSQNLGVVKWVWGVAENRMNFQNSLKMKISIVIGFVHMSFGLILKIANEVKRGQKKQIVFDSVPRLLLMLCTVGFLVLLIIVKWLNNYEDREYQAPSIIMSFLQLSLIASFLQISPTYSIFSRQKEVASILNTISICSILVMLVYHTFRTNSHYQALQRDEAVEEMNLELSQSNDHFNSFISEPVSYYHQRQRSDSSLGPLEVFQYVLSLISSTTSYLRLFALSLAHGKLSSLLLNFLTAPLFEPEPSISIIKCLVFFVVTAVMILILDFVECVMHVVRLHWIQWMGKFYVGNGVIFKPESEDFSIGETISYDLY